jgi:hypothetical protein
MPNIYVLEVVKFLIHKNWVEGFEGWSDNNGIVEHIGYMKAKFKTKDDACTYYDRHNTHMRKLNSYGTYISDWDPKSKLMYIVREDYMINATIPPFSEEDLPINNI